MNVLRPNRHAASILGSTLRFYRENDLDLTQSTLDAYLSLDPATRDLRVAEILPRMGKMMHYMARLRDGEGQSHFFKISRPSDEFQFFANARAIAENLEGHDVQIVWPSHLIKTASMLALIAPYHETMISRDGGLELRSACAAVSRLNSNARQLHGILAPSKQQRRTTFLPNVIRRTILSTPFLAKERSRFTRTYRVLKRYQEVQRPVAKAFCHGDIHDRNVFQQNGKTLIIDFGNYYFAEPGMDLASLYDGIEDRLEPACEAYASTFDGPLLRPNLRLAVLYGYFLKRLRWAARGVDNLRFQASLERLESALDADF